MPLAFARHCVCTGMHRRGEGGMRGAPGRLRLSWGAEGCLAHLLLTTGPPLQQQQSASTSCASVQQRAHRTAPHRRQSRIVHVSQIVGRNTPCRPGQRSACRPMAAAAECAQRAVGKTRPRRRPAVAAELHIGQYLSVVLVTLSVQRLVRGRAAASRPEIVSSFVERAGLLAHSARSEKQHYCTNFNL
jgi:hypothetical protein